MLKDITLGQFFPGNTLIHNLDPRTKLNALVIYIVALFLALDFLAYSILFLFMSSCILISRIKISTILKGLKPLLIVMSVTALLSIFWTQGTVIWSYAFLSVTVEGIRNAIFMLLRILLLISATFMLTYTTSPLQLTEALEKILAPLNRIKLPVHEFAMMMSIALRFIPTLIEETDKIMSAQKARGADFDTGNLLQKAKAMLPLLIPLFISAFRRADDLATAMESRCYNGGTGRTKLKQLRYDTRDLAAYLATLLLLIIIILIRFFNL